MRNLALFAVIVALLAPVAVAGIEDDKARALMLPTVGVMLAFLSQCGALLGI